ncbi:uncharacterized protein LAJ45_08353 [Morchella importuna]|uniref:uncharacterized protein n=1 Tax=Morchella importuna TaxID=1174673 RepID=UPI001E8E2DE7|nr:uncharacterized protein LAJ45_08353 [Morchella importuna]KAH8147526.1 hypothetical protein LAJ45_08353 [Morchella importuna]
MEPSIIKTETTAIDYVHPHESSGRTQRSRQKPPTLPDPKVGQPSAPKLSVIPYQHNLPKSTPYHGPSLDRAPAMTVSNMPYHIR